MINATFALVPIWDGLIERWTKTKKETKWRRMDVGSWNHKNTVAFTINHMEFVTDDSQSHLFPTHTLHQLSYVWLPFGISKRGKIIRWMRDKQVEWAWPKVNEAQNENEKSELLNLCLMRWNQLRNCLRCDVKQKLIRSISFQSICNRKKVNDIRNRRCMSQWGGGVGWAIASKNGERKCVQHHFRR